MQTSLSAQIESSHGRPPGRGALRTRVFGLALLLGAVGVSCADSTAPGLALLFETDQVLLDTDLTGAVALRNGTDRVVGPVTLRGGPVSDESGALVPGVRLEANPERVATMAPGDDVLVRLSVAAGGQLQSGSYTAELVAEVEGIEHRLAVLLSPQPLLGPPLRSVTIGGGAASVRQGDVTRFSVSGVDSGGDPVADPPVVWSVSPAGAGYVTAGGELVAYEPGSLSLRVEASGASAETEVEVTARGRSGSLLKVGEGVVAERHTSDLWVHGDFAYTGTWGQRTQGGVPRWGNALHVWDVSDPALPQRTRTLTVDARTVNDIKVREDGRLALLTHEGSNDGLNGVTLLSLDDPSDPRIIGRYTQGLESGIHNAWLEGDYAYLVMDGVGNGLRVLDVSDPANPRVVATWYAGSSFLHDVYVRDGLAFLAHWGAGLAILDVGNGLRGGSPENPVEVGRLSALGGETHNAWYWPERGYVFVGEEDFASPGIMHVIDVRHPSAPVEVATFRVPGTTPHNFWLDEDAEILYLAWYENGVRALDVGGTLLGDLDRQGRELFGERYDGAGFGCVSVQGTCSWAPQLHEGLLYVSDMNKGLVVLQPTF